MNPQLYPSSSWTSPFSLELWLYLAGCDEVHHIQAMILILGAGASSSYCKDANVHWPQGCPNSWVLMLLTLPPLPLENPMQGLPGSPHSKKPFSERAPSSCSSQAHTKPRPWAQCLLHPPFQRGRTPSCFCSLA